MPISLHRTAGALERRAIVQRLEKDVAVDKLKALPIKGQHSHLLRRTGKLDVVPSGVLYDLIMFENAWLCHARSAPIRTRAKIACMVHLSKRQCQQLPADAPGTKSLLMSCSSEKIIKSDSDN
jgi:hypothetical protein